MTLAVAVDGIVGACIIGWGVMELHAFCSGSVHAGLWVWMVLYIMFCDR